jgi:pimeloyl-ACP methyl ester carboxylesterase
LILLENIARWFVLQFVGGEWTISPGTLRSGHMHDMARALNGALFYTEHRYYGETKPVANLRLENLRWLSIDQALADLAHFIEDIKQNMPIFRDSPVILVGCSYSATMVTWFMQKYPHLAKGAWSLSAPLLAKVDFVEYKEVVSYAIEEVGGAQCANRIKTAFTELEAMYAARNAANFKRLFFLCTDIDFENKLDVWSLFSDISSTWSGLVQYYDRYYRDIENACEGLMSYDEPTELESYAKWITNRWRLSQTNCYDHTYESFLRDWNGTSWDDWIARSEWRQWLYQTCSEYGWYQSSGSDNILFGSMFPVEYSLQWCYDLYDSL